MIPGKNHHISTRQRSSQRGMASILITLITMIVISLIVLGFAAISRREQRQSLDQQLSTQAFYAAESAVEDAKHAISTRLAAGLPLVGKGNCTQDDQAGGFPSGAASMLLDAANNVSYTCLTVNMAPGNLQYDSVGDRNVVAPIRTETPIDRLEITWQPAAAPNGGRPQDQCPNGTAGIFSSQANWTCGYGLLRTDLVSTAGTMTSGGLMAGTLAGFFVPTSNGANGQLPFGNVGRPNAVAADCGRNAYTACRASITGLNGQSYAMRLSSLYRASQISIAAYRNNAPVPIVGAQVAIDATGKAQDVLRRIQVRVPLANGPEPPGFAIQSNRAICKRFTATPTYFNIPSDIIDADTGHPMCLGATVGQPPALCYPNNDIALVADTSGSMEDDWQTITRFAKLKQVLLRFAAETNISPTTNRGALISFSTDANLRQELTGDSAVLTAAINALDTEDRTNYLKGLLVAETELFGPRGRPGLPKIILFISDGQPTDDRAAIRVKTTELKDRNVRIFTIGIGSTDGGGGGGGGLDEQLLSDMSGNGGYYSDAASESALDAIFRTLTDELNCT